MTQWLRKLVDDRKGNVFALYALSVPVILLAAGFAVDFGLAAQLRTRLNAAADAAALAAVTPSMMKQTNATAQTAAVNMFNGQASALTGLQAGSVNVTVTITNPNGNALFRQVQVCYTAAEQTMFTSVLWPATTIPLGNCATAQAQSPPNIDFYVLLDNSPSMQLPSTSAGVSQMETLTPLEDTGGCAFACHEANTNTNSDIIGNPCLNGATLTTPTVSACDPNLTNNPSNKCSNTNPYMANAYCSSTQGTQIDNYALAHNHNITLKLDVLNNAISTLMQTALNTANSTAYTPPPAYRFSISSMDSLWKVGFTQLMSLTANYVSGWATASANFGVMEYWQNNNTCTTSACTAGNPYSSMADAATNYDNSLSKLNDNTKSYGCPTPATAPTRPATPRRKCCSSSPTASRTKRSPARAYTR